MTVFDVERRGLSAGTVRANRDDGSALLDSRLVTSDGTRLHVRATGPSDAAVTAVFVHGWTQDHRSWDLIVEQLPGDVRVVCYDHRGHGASDPAAPGTRTLQQLADDLAEVITATTSGPVVVVGHSMGGMTLMALAERHPQLVERTVAGAAFVATSSGNMHRTSLGIKGAIGRTVPKVEPTLRALLESRKKGTLPGSPAVLSPATRWLVFGKKARQADVVQTARQALAAHPPSVGGLLEAIFAHDRRVALGALRRKATVVFVGDADRLCPVAHAKVIADELPDTDFVLYPGAGHMLMYERTAEVSLRVTRLVRQVSPAR